MPGELQIFEHQTVRLIVHTSLGGSKIRIRISNIHGTQPLILGGVHLALAGDGATSVPGTDRVVTFDGKPTVALKAKRELLSDIVEIPMPACSALAISMFFPNRTPATTSHFLALQTGYVSLPNGDFTSAASFPVERTIESWPFITAVEVQTPDKGNAIVVFGDSTVDGDGSTSNRNRRWTDLLRQRLYEVPGRREFVGILNEGIIGNRLLVDSPHDGEFGDALGEAGRARFTRDALDQPGVSTVIVRIGVNDIGMPGAIVRHASPVTSAALVEGFRVLISMAHARGVRIIGATITPLEGATLAANFYTPEKEAVRQEVNAWLREQHEFDALIDLDRVLRDPNHPSRLAVQYDSGDHLHSNDSGYAASADAVDLSQLAISQTSPRT
jgi:lysophospholipase L1-like esterase